MSEKLADDYGFKKLAADLAAHAGIVNSFV